MRKTVFLKFSKVVILIYIPTNSTQGFPFLHILANTLISCLFYNSHSDRCDDYLFVILICISLISDAEPVFMYLLAICISSLKKCLFTSSAHSLIRLLVFFCYWVAWALYIFWILTSYQIYDLQVIRYMIICYHLVECPFIFLIVSFGVQKLVLCSPTCLFLLLLSLLLVSNSWKLSPRPMSKSFTPVSF